MQRARSQKDRKWPAATADPAVRRSATLAAPSELRRNLRWEPRFPRIRAPRYKEAPATLATHCRRHHAVCRQNSPSSCNTRYTDPFPCDRSSGEHSTNSIHSENGAYLGDFSYGRLPALPACPSCQQASQGCPRTYRGVAESYDYRAWDFILPEHMALSSGRPFRASESSSHTQRTQRMDRRKDPRLAQDIVDPLTRGRDTAQAAPGALDGDEAAVVLVGGRTWARLQGKGGFGERASS